MTINDNWGIHSADHNHKATRHLIHTLVRAASAGANLLLNVGPTAEGEILPVHVERLRRIGTWLRAGTNGASVYGTRAASIPPTRETVSTRNGDTHFVHVLEDISDVLVLKSVPDSVTRARLLSTGTHIALERTADSVRLTIPEALRDPFDTVVALS